MATPKYPLSGAPRIHKFNYIISFIIHLWNLNTSIRSDYTITWIHKSSFNAVQAETRSTCLGQVVIVGLLRGDHTKLVGGWGWGTWSFLLTPYKGFFTVAYLYRNYCLQSQRATTHWETLDDIVLSELYCYSLVFFHLFINFFFFGTFQRQEYFCQRHYNDMFCFVFVCFVSGVF